MTRGILASTNVTGYVGVEVADLLLDERDEALTKVKRLLAALERIASSEIPGAAGMVLYAQTVLELEGQLEQC
jgi:hypothetical protein